MPITGNSLAVKQIDLRRIARQSCIKVSLALYQGPEFRHLEYFLAVAEETKFSKAANRLHVSQPSLSRQIQQLEEGLGSKLFTRTQLGVFLTPAGTAFWTYARKMLRLRQEAIDLTSIAGSGIESPFRFGYSPWIEQDLVQEIFTGYRESTPAGILEPTSSGSAALIRMVLDGSLRAALVDQPVNESQLYTQTVCSEKLMLCMRADDPFSTAEVIARSEVEERLRIMFARDLHPSLYDRIERKLSKANIRLRPREFVLHPTDLQFLVKERAGWALLRNSLSLESGLVLKPIAGVPLTVKSALVCLPVLEHPVLPMLAYRVAKYCISRRVDRSQLERKPAARVDPSLGKQERLFG